MAQNAPVYCIVASNRGTERAFVGLCREVQRESVKKHLGFAQLDVMLAGAGLTTWLYALTTLGQWL